MSEPFKRRSTSDASEAKFRQRVAERGGQVLESEWLGVCTPHLVQCSRGHERKVRPHSVNTGKGLCATCAGSDPAAAWDAFRQRVLSLGGVVLEEEWLGKDKPHRVRCPQGHEATPSPTSIQQGRGICRFCAGMQWDVFYIVMHDGSDRIKFGITSGDHRDRLRRHARAGYKTLIRLLTDLPGSVAPDLERFVKSALALAGETPIHGREYFSAGALALVLDVVDNFPLRLANCVSTTRDDLPGYPAL